MHNYTSKVETKKNSKLSYTNTRKSGDCMSPTQPKTRVCTQPIYGVYKPINVVPLISSGS